MSAEQARRGRPVEAGAAPWARPALDKLFAKRTLRYAVRGSFGAARCSRTVALLTLAIGCGANTAIFTGRRRRAAEAAALSRIPTSSSPFGTTAPGAPGHHGTSPAAYGSRHRCSLQPVSRRAIRSRSIGMWVRAPRRDRGSADPEQVHVDCDDGRRIASAREFLRCSAGGSKPSD